jgi:hypothetical protein
MQRVTFEGKPVPKQVQVKPRLALLLGSTVVVCLVLLNWAKDFSLSYLRERARQQDNIASIARSVAVFSDPLPANFCWLSGLAMPFSDSVTVQDQRRFMVITIVSNQRLTTGLRVLDRSIDFGTKLGKDLIARKWRKIGAGAVSVSGHDLNYEIGEVVLGAHKVRELRGSLLLKSKNVDFDAFGQIDKPFDLAQFRSFLDCIKELN